MEAWLSFNNYGLQDTLKQLMCERNTGTLTCDVKGYEKKLFVKDGVCCFATSTDPEDKLPNVLIRQGRFDEEQFENAEPNFNSSVSVGRNLVEMGLITQQELVQGAKEQVYSVFASCMQTESGQSNFEEGDLPNGVVSLPLKYPQAFVRAILDMSDKAWISSQFGGALSFIPTPVEGKKPDLEAMELGDFAKPLFELIDGEANFNQIAFEADVDDFLLLKFLFGMSFMGFITIEDDEEEPEPEVDDVLDDLNEAMEQREELERLKESGLEGVSMDETIALPKGQTEDMGGSMDVTMEISRDALAADEPAFAEGGMDVTTEIERPEGLDDLGADDAFPEDPEEDDEDEEDEAATAAAFEAAFAEAEAEEEDEEAGLDDLGDMSEDVFDNMGEETSDDEEPEGPEEEDEAPTRNIPDDVIMPDDEDDDFDDEDFDEDEPRDKRRLLLIAAVGLIAASLLIYTRPYLERYFNPFGTSETETLQADLEVIDGPPDGEETPQDTPTDTPNTAEATGDSEGGKEGEVAARETESPPTTDPEPTEVASQNTDDPPPEEETSKEPPQQTEQTEQVAENQTPKPPPVENESIEKDAPVETNQPEEDLVIATNENDKTEEERAFRSPVAEGWDTSTRRPRGRLQKAVDLPPVQVSTAVTPIKENKAPPKPQPKKSSAPPPKKQASPPVIRSKPKPKPDRSIQPTTSRQAPMVNRDYAGAAKAWLPTLEQNREKYTVHLYSYCKSENLGKAFRDAQGSDQFRIVEYTNWQSSTCYRVIWGIYDSKEQAEAARATLPNAYSKAGMDIKQIDKLLN